MHYGVCVCITNTVVAVLMLLLVVVVMVVVVGGGGAAGCPPHYCFTIRLILYKEILLSYVSINSLQRNIVIICKYNLS